MNKDKIRKTIDRLPAILKAIKDSRENTNSNRSDRSAKAPPLVDEETLAIIGILDDIIEHEPTDWIRKLLESFKRKKTDISRMEEVPVSRAKYYLIKSGLVDKIYECCISKGYVTHSDIMNEKIR